MPHFNRVLPYLPFSVRILFKVIHCIPERSKPRTFHGVATGEKFRTCVSFYMFFHATPIGLFVNDACQIGCLDFSLIGGCSFVSLNIGRFGLQLILCNRRLANSCPRKSGGAKYATTGNHSA